MTRLNFIPLKILWILIAAAGTVFYHAQLQNITTDQQLTESVELIPTAPAVSLVSLGFDQVVADYFWLEFVNYVGDSKKRSLDRYDRADKYIDLITGLDPQFVQAYWFAMFIVSGEQRRPDRAADLIERGIRANPNNWYLPFIAGVNQLLYAKNDDAAAKYYRQAAKYPGAPNWLERQAQIIEAHAPRLIKEGYSWLSIFKSASESRVREHAKEQSVRIWVRAFKSAPNTAYKDEARRVLYSLGVDIDAIAAMVAPRSGHR